MVKCRDCRYAVSRPAGSIQMHKLGYMHTASSETAVCECHWRPPVAHVNDGGYSHMATFPLVDPDNWCAAGEPPR